MNRITPVAPDALRCTRLAALRAKLFATSGATLGVADDRDDAAATLFTRRGVADLHALLKSDPALLRGALVADRVIGLGAAALMAAAGVAAYTTPVASGAAVEFLSQAGIPGVVDSVVPAIINRAGTGPCPLESRLRGIDGLSCILTEIDGFVAGLTK